MSLSIAQETNYLEQKDEVLEQMLADQVASGDMAARNRRRRDNPAATPMEVNNRDTAQIMGKLQTLKQQIRELNSVVKDLI